MNLSSFLAKNKYVELLLRLLYPLIAGAAFFLEYDSLTPYLLTLPVALFCPPLLLLLLNMLYGLGIWLILHLLSGSLYTATIQNSLIPVLMLILLLFFTIYACWTTPSCRWRPQHLYRLRPVLWLLLLGITGFEIFFEYLSFHTCVQAIILISLCLRRLPYIKAPPTKFSHCLATGLLCSISLLLSLLLLEGGARLRFTPEAAECTLYISDTESIWRLRPGFDAEEHINAEEDTWRSFKVTISQGGFRDNAFGPKTPEEFRIAIMGDSYTFGAGLRPGETYDDLIEKRLNAIPLNKNVRVLNMGVGGFGPWQEHLMLKRTGFAFDPDLVILQTFIANDISDTLRREDRRLHSYFPDQERYVARHRFNHRPEVRIDNWLRQHSALHVGFCEILKNPLPLSVLAWGLRCYPSPEPEREYPEMIGNPLFEPDRTDWYPALQRGSKALEADIRAIQADCHARGIDFIAFNTPYPHCEACYERWTPPELRDHYTPFKGSRHIEAFFSGAGIPHISLLEAFLGHPDPEGLVFQADGHLNPAGAAFLIDQVIGYLLQEYLPKKEGLSSSKS